MKIEITDENLLWGLIDRHRSCLEVVFKESMEALDEEEMLKAIVNFNLVANYHHYLMSCLTKLREGNKCDT